MKKTVKAWAVVDVRGRPVGTYRKKDYAQAVAPAGPSTVCVLPCTITYDLPKKRAKK